MNKLIRFELLSICGEAIPPFLMSPSRLDTTVMCTFLVQNMRGNNIYVDLWPWKTKICEAQKWKNRPITFYVEKSQALAWSQGQRILVHMYVLSQFINDWQLCCRFQLSFLARSAKVAERAICFTDRNFYLFFNDFSETNYLKVRWTDFRNLYVEWKLFGRRWSIWTSFSDISRDVAMATDFMQKWQNSPFSSLWHSETVWGNAVYV